MYFDFPTILFFAALVTGVIWGVDAWFLAPKRNGNVSGIPDSPDDSSASSNAAAQGSLAAPEPLIVEYSRSFFPIIVIVLVLRSFLVEPFRIPSGSMMPTLRAGDFILVNKFSYGIRLPVINKKILEINTPQRGDVAVFRYPVDPSTDYIKRIIGLPGDHISYHNKQVYINGVPLEYEDAGIYRGDGVAISMSGSFLKKELAGSVKHDILLERRRIHFAYTCMSEQGFTVPQGQYFVMGDNRDNSQDSRFWCGVPEENLIGKAFMIWMNWDSSGGGVGWSRIGSWID